MIGYKIRTAAGVVAVMVLVGSQLPAHAAAAAQSAKASEPAVAIPMVEGPVTGGKGTPANAAGFDLAAVGYEQAEYFISGNATAYTSAQPLTSDGRWTVTAGSTAPFKTRILVARPASKRAFNGTVFVEWNNVSAGGEATPDWASAHNEITRAGAAWVGVSAQATGVVGNTSLVGALLQPLVKIDPDRYGTLTHPGDSYSYDIFSQAGAAVRAPTPSGINPLGKLKVDRVIAVGESQSAFRLTTYANALHKVTNVFDAYLIHSRQGGSAALSQAPLTAIAAPTPTYIRDDLDAPVIVLITETDLVVLGYRAARQDDAKRLRTWEVAGTAHADAGTLASGADEGDGSTDVAIFAAMATPPATPVLGCAPAINAGHQVYVVRAAVHALDAWVRDATAPPRAPRLEMDATGGAFVVDEHGNVRGGIRTPAVDAPVATLSGIAVTGGGLCRLFGATTPFDGPTLLSLYPTHAAFVKAWNKAVAASVKAGFVLAADSGNLERAAAQSTISSGA
ncbi:MAG: alpha/beta hydrolase domain-containing protein [Acidimicrobiia bacterium]